MALPELLHAMEQDAATQIAGILAAARARSSELEADANRERAQRYAEAAERCAQRMQAAADVQISDAQRRARAASLTARAAMLERIRAALRARLPELALAVDRELIRAAVAAAGPRNGVLRCRPAFAIPARALAPPTLSVEASEELTTGVVITLASGTQIVATLDALLDREWPTLAARALALAAAEAAP